MGEGKDKRFDRLYLVGATQALHYGSEQDDARTFYHLLPHRLGNE